MTDRREIESEEKIDMETLQSYPGTGPSVVMMGFSPSFFLLLFTKLGLVVVAEFVPFPFPFPFPLPLPLAPAINGSVVEGAAWLTAGAEDGSVASFAPFIVSTRRSRDK